MSTGKKAKGGRAHAVLDLIGRLYDVERQAEKQKLKPEQTVALRAEKSRPILDKLKALLEARVVQPTHDQIALRAQHIWRQKGCLWGQEDENWLEAETQLIAELNGKKK